MMVLFILIIMASCIDPVTATSYARYDPSKGYYWEFPNDPSSEKSSQKASKPKQEEPDNTQRKRVDLLLGDLVKKFPPKAFARKVTIFTVFPYHVVNQLIHQYCYRMVENL